MTSLDESRWRQYAPILGNRVATSLPCPEWCELPTGHAFETVAIGDNPLRVVAGPGDSDPAGVKELFRVHRRRFGDRPTHVAVETYERTMDAGRLPEGPDSAALVRVQLPEGHAHVTADGARRLAALLVAAADLAAESVGRRP